MFDFLRLLSCVTSSMLPRIACPIFHKVTQVTKNASVRLLPSVYLIVDSQTTFLWLVLTTLAALISFFTVILYFVHLQMGSKNTSKFAFIASQGLLSSMFQLVRPQIIYFKWDKFANNACFCCVSACGSSNCFFLKIFATKNAFLRLFPRVGHIVVAQMAFLGCFLITLSAIILSFCSLSFFKLFPRGVLLCLTKHMFFSLLKNASFQCHQACGFSRLLMGWNLFHRTYKSASKKWLFPSVAQYLVLEGSM